MALISKVLEQNPRSYANLDDLIGIGRNLVSAGLANGDDTNDEPNDEQDTERVRKNAERRVTFMAIEAALKEDDFETAYSYIVNRLTPSAADIQAPKVASNHSRKDSKSSTTIQEDDTSWRAAFLAGRYRPTTSTPPTLRRLEQRTELLSLALLLAPTSSLTEILAAWRRCEEETSALQREQAEAEQTFDDHADKRMSTSALPGNFTFGEEQPALLMNQRRREMGRLGNATSTGGGGGDAPVSMFDLTRSAAQAFSKNAFPLRSASRSGTETHGMDESVESLGSEDRVRKRDMVANAASGVLTSGLGWVLGAQPAAQQGSER